jgi:FKBP-type peptidyl-prolyl cis-trans isomerase (trigger factor)
MSQEVGEYYVDVQVEYQRDSDVVRLTISVPSARCNAAYSKVLASLRKDYTVPGFRNNEKVPTDMLIKAAGGDRQFSYACVEEILHSTVEEVPVSIRCTFVIGMDIHLDGCVTA